MANSSHQIHAHTLAQAFSIPTYVNMITVSGFCYQLISSLCNLGASNSGPAISHTLIHCVELIPVDYFLKRKSNQTLPFVFQYCAIMRCNHNNHTLYSIWLMSTCRTHIRRIHSKSLHSSHEGTFFLLRCDFIYEYLPIHATSELRKCVRYYVSLTYLLRLFNNRFVHHWRGEIELAVFIQLMMKMLVMIRNGSEVISLWIITSPIWMI